MNCENPQRTAVNRKPFDIDELFARVRALLRRRADRAGGTRGAVGAVCAGRTEAKVEKQEADLYLNPRRVR